MKNWVAALLVAVLSLSSLSFASDHYEHDRGKVNINTASAEELDMELKYVGETVAKRIVEYREKHGNFTKVEELTNVRGVGEKTVEANKPNIVFK